jgi:hypothetical protein
VSPKYHDLKEEPPVKKTYQMWLAFIVAFGLNMNKQASPPNIELFEVLFFGSQAIPLNIDLFATLFVV